MKKQLLTSILTIFFLSLDFMAFAQNGDDEESGPGFTASGGGKLLESDDDIAQTPINGKLIWLLIVGLAFAYYTYKKNIAAKTVN